MQAKDKVTTEVGLLVKGGESIHVQLVSTVVKNDQQHTFEYRTAINDITELKRVEEALQESEALYRTMAENAEDFIFIIDNHEYVKYVNNFAARPFRCNPEELSGWKKLPIPGSQRTSCCNAR